MANVNVTYQQMHDAAGRLVNGQHEIEANLNQLLRLVDQLVGEGYVTDRSSIQFGHAYTEFSTGAKTTIAGLEGMARYLTTAATTFQDADLQLAGALHG